MSETRSVQKDMSIVRRGTPKTEVYVLITESLPRRRTIPRVAVNVGDVLYREPNQRGSRPKAMSKCQPASADAVHYNLRSSLRTRKRAASPFPMAAAAQQQKRTKLVTRSSTSFRSESCCSTTSSRSIEVMHTATRSKKVEGAKREAKKAMRKWPASKETLMEIDADPKTSEVVAVGARSSSSLRTPSTTTVDWNAHKSPRAIVCTGSSPLKVVLKLAPKPPVVVDLTPSPSVSQIHLSPRVRLILRRPTSSESRESDIASSALGPIMQASSLSSASSDEGLLTPEIGPAVLPEVVSSNGLDNGAGFDGVLQPAFEYAGKGKEAWRTDGTFADSSEVPDDPCEDNAEGKGEKDTDAFGDDVGRGRIQADSKCTTFAAWLAIPHSPDERSWLASALPVECGRCRVGGARDSSGRGAETEIDVGVSVIENEAVQEKLESAEFRLTQQEVGVASLVNSAPPVEVRGVAVTDAETLPHLTSIANITPSAPSLTPTSPPPEGSELVYMAWETTADTDSSSVVAYENELRALGLAVSFPDDCEDENMTGSAETVLEKASSLLMV